MYILILYAHIVCAHECIGILRFYLCTVMFNLLIKNYTVGLHTGSRSGNISISYSGSSCLDVTNSQVHAAGR